MEKIKVKRSILFQISSFRISVVKKLRVFISYGSSVKMIKMLYFRSVESKMVS